MTEPRILDGCCCAGAASKGYANAGFTVTGYDISPQPNYPYPFILGDLLDLDPEWLARNFDAVHVSPPCQGYSGMTNCRPIAKARAVMEVDWTTRHELAEAIPPYYTEYVGAALMAHLSREVAA